MYKSLFILAALLLGVQSVIGQTNAKAADPRIMVIPANIWCQTNGYWTAIDDMGEEDGYPNYNKALLNDRNLRSMIMGIEELLDGFEVESFERALNNLKTKELDNSTATSKSGASIAESPRDMLLSAMTPDIVVDLDFYTIPQGPKMKIAFTLQAIDAASATPISTCQGETTSGRPDQIPSMLKEAILSMKDKFLTKMMDHFNDMVANGREITVELYRWDDCPIDYEEEFAAYDDSELNEIIENWVSDHTVNSNYYLQGATADQMTFLQVRIPLWDEKGKQYTARTFAKDLAKFIKDVTDQKCKYENKGMGKGIVTMGGK